MAASAVSSAHFQLLPRAEFLRVTLTSEEGAGRLLISPLLEPRSSPQRSARSNKYGTGLAGDFRRSNWAAAMTCKIACSGLEISLLSCDKSMSAAAYCGTAWL